MADRLTGKTCLVTGAARGIGLAISERMMSEGARVVMSDIDLDAVRKAAEPHAGKAIAVAHDVTRAQDWQAALGVSEAAFGSLNVLVNNAGICITGTIEDLAEADWDRTMEIDLKSVFLGCKAAMPVLARHAPASIINISSIAAFVAGHNFTAYNAAKAGVHMMTKSIALHGARKGYQVRANTLNPAFIDTGMVDDVVASGNPSEARAKLARQIPLGRIGTPGDVAHAAVYLASDESSFMTGAEIKLDGGLSAM